MPFLCTVRRALPRVFASVLMLAAAACAYMPLSTLYRLRSFDLGTFDPAALRVALQVPEVLERRPGAVVRLEVWTQPDKRDLKEHVISMESVQEAGERAPLAAFAKEGMKTHLYKVSARDVMVIRALQAEGVARHRAGQKGGGVEIKPEPKACRTRDIPPGPFPAHLLVQLVPTEGYMVVLRNVDLHLELSQRGLSLEAQVPPC
jgi:hypothetical protein